jgi:hypothetical protein
MEDAIKKVQEFLDETARRCLRLIGTRKLKASQYQRLAKFIFGCMNQKHDLQRRIEEHGAEELDKVIRFAAKAAEVLLEIDAENIESENHED